jgi:hypothetical protein
MLFLVFLGTLTVLLLLTVFLVGHEPDPSQKPAQAATLAGKSSAAPLRFRVIVRPRPAAPQPPPLEGFVRGTSIKPLPHPSAAADPVSPAPQRTATTPAPRQAAIRQPSPGSPRDNIELGRQLLGTDGKREGRVPLISMDYRATLGWSGYVTEMQHLGGEFFLYDPAHQQILAQVDMRNHQFSTVATEALRPFSPRVRQIEEEPAVAPLLAGGRQRFHVAEPSLILLLPLETDFEIVGGLVRALTNLATAPKPVARVSGVYEPADGGVQLHVFQLFDPEGNGQRCDLVLPLQRRNQVSGAQSMLGR